MDQAEHQNSGSRAGLKSEGLETAHVLECLVDDRQTNDRINDVGIRADAAERAAKQRQAVADREEAHVQQNVFEAIQKEDHPDEEQRRWS